MKMSNENELIPFVFKDTGRKVMIRKVSPMLMLNLSRQFPAPTPPKQEVDYGDGKKVMEENPVHPAYLEAKQQYEIDQNHRVQELLIKRGVAVDMSEAVKEVQELREFWKSTYGQDLPETDDALVYVMDICAGTQEDIQELIAAVTQRSRATEKQISEAQGMFSG